MTVRELIQALLQQPDQNAAAVVTAEDDDGEVHVLAVDRVASFKAYPDLERLHFEGNNGPQDVVEIILSGGGALPSLGHVHPAALAIGRRTLGIWTSLRVPR